MKLKPVFFSFVVLQAWQLAQALPAHPADAANAVSATGAAGVAGTATRATKPCQGSSESWTYSETLKKDWKEEGISDFEEFVSGKTPSVQGFADALAMRAKSESREGKMLAEYWMSRALLTNTLPHVAHSGFSAVLSQPVKPESAWIQAAAAGCLAQIDLKQPGLGVPKPVVARLAELPAKSDDIQALASLAVRQALSPPSGDGTVDRKLVASLLEIQSGNATYGAFSRGLWSAFNHRHPETVTEMERYIKAAPESPLHARFVDTAHLLAGRALYAMDATGPVAGMDKINAAIAHYKAINKSSNELAESLTELAWAYLMAERYSEAIGTSVSLQAGGLRHTFTPESNMVMAMALNEICQYPESVRAVRQFQKSYEPSHVWIKSKFPAVASNLYPLAVGYIKKTSDVPRAVASEWVRSPVFITSQGELNLLIDEKASALGLSKAGSGEQDALVVRMLELLKGLAPDYTYAKKNQKEGEELPSKVVSDLRKLRKQLISFYRLRKAAPIWRTILARHEDKSPKIRARLLASINQELKARTERMQTQIEEIAENIQLVEVEIYNGASQDIIWQNAHPEYKELARKMKDDKAKIAREQVWDWGRAIASSDEQTEIWEDELGSFKADLFDNCSSKDKFLALRVSPRARAQGSN